MDKRVLNVDVGLSIVEMLEVKLEGAFPGLVHANKYIIAQINFIYSLLLFRKQRVVNLK